jgi:hypothetical protein
MSGGKNQAHSIAAQQVVDAVLSEENRTGS